MSGFSSGWPGFLLAFLLVVVFPGGFSPLSRTDIRIGSVQGQPSVPTHHRRLSDYVSHYEPLTYDPSPVHEEHLRHKRSVPGHHGGGQSGSSLDDPEGDDDGDHRVRLGFSSHGRRFELALKRDHSVFHDQLVIHDQDENELGHLDTAHIYEGRLIDEPSSHCFGAIRDGVFDGQIHTREGTFYVERAQRYAPENPDLSRAPASSNEEEDGDGDNAVHSVIYHEKHIRDPFQHSKNVMSPPPGCGSAAPGVQKWMSSIQAGAVPGDAKGRHAPSPAATPPKTEEPVAPPPTPAELRDEGGHFKYTAEANRPGGRVKRSLENPSKKKSCSLYIQTDPLFWRHVRDQENDDAKTEEEILSLIAQHVKAVNRIYSDTSFDGKYKHTGYQFEVQRIKIHNDSLCKSSGRVSHDQNQFCIPNVDVSNFLNLHSKNNHEVFCLAYVFTYRDFTGGTLGLAWVASASGASGGICETYKRYTESVNGVHHTAKRSLNTGIITFVNYNSRVPPKVSQLTLAHEIGHNFGSPHDWPSECRPGGVRGNYIMFASATSGDRDNNNQFSGCSKYNISAVLDAITEGRKPNCFTESDGAFCGNKIVEEGEECDCGFDEHECQEQCCFPRKSDSMSDEENKKNRCKRKPNTECSPSEGPCCSQSCRFISSWENLQCKNEDDCTAASKCNGNQATCPEPRHKEDHVTECNEGTQVCQDGECKRSICLKFGLESCFLDSQSARDKRELCELACRLPSNNKNKANNNNTCLATSDLVKRGLIQGLDEGLSLRPGSPCDNFQGYCDVFLKCRKVDAEGPLARLKNLVFNTETLKSIQQWVTEYWYFMMLICVGAVIFVAICIRCFAIHTPSSNPNLPKNLHFGETLRRPVRSLQHKQYRQASGHEAPPPYPGRSQRAGGGGGSGSGGGSGGVGTPTSAMPPGAPPGVPSHGYGEGRGHYNRSRYSDVDGAAAADPRRQLGSSSGGAGGDRRSQQYRASRLEMKPMR